MSWPGVFLGPGRRKGGPRHFKACNENSGPWCGGFIHPAGREMEGGRGTLLLKNLKKSEYS